MHTACLPGHDILRRHQSPVRSAPPAEQHPDTSHAIPTMISNAHKYFDADGNLTDDGTKKLIGQLLEGLVALARQLAK